MPRKNIFLGSDVRKIMIISSEPNEGKSFIAMSLWKQMALAGEKTILVDADMRRSFLVRRHRIETDGEMLGLAHYLVGQCALGDCLYETNLFGACIIPAGRDVSNPISLIDSVYFTSMLDDLAANFDVVLIDAPPVGMVIDAAEMAASCDGSVLVVEYSKTHLRDLQACRQQMGL